MKKLNKIMLALSILPTLLTSVFLFFMNDTVPMHYNASGAVDRYGSKYENFIFPAIINIKPITVFIMNGTLSVKVVLSGFKIARIRNIN